MVMVDYLSKKILSSAPENVIYQLVLLQIKSWTIGNIKDVVIVDAIFELINLFRSKFIEEKYG